MVKEINSIEDFFKEIFIIQEEIDTYNNDNKSIMHKNLAFRGQENKQFELLPAIGRGHIIEQERNLIELSKYRMPNIFKSDLIPIDLLALLQHYGIPTRLLDVSANPLVALYFAATGIQSDGEVFVFEYNDSNLTNYPIINAIAESYKFAKDIDLVSFFDNIFIQPYFDEQRNSFENETDEQKSKWIKECCKDLIFVRAAEQLERQKLQQGFYILFPNKISEYGGVICFDKSIEPISKNDEQLKARFIIKREAKTDISKKLEFLGISKATLFADNIDIVCENIINQCRDRRY